jgi:chromosome segregation ATPase
MAKHDTRVGGLTFEEVCETKDSKRLNAWRELRKVNEQGKRCQTDFTKAEIAVNSMQMEIAKVEVQVSQIDGNIRQLTRLPGEFDTDIPKAAREKVDKLQAQRARLMKERFELKAAQARSRMQAVQLAEQIQRLRRSQRNLTAVVEGRDPAEGPKGSVNYVSL